MKRLHLIGVGAGDPEQLTLQAVSALRTVDVVFVVDKSDPGSPDGRPGHVDELARWREELLRRHRPDGGHRVVTIADPRRNRAPHGQAGYERAVTDWHAARAGAYEDAFAAVAEDAVGAFLVWGDPSLYDSTIRITEDVLARGRVSFDWSVIPGVSSLHALTAAHRIVLHGVGRPVAVTTGRRLADDGWPGRPGEFDDVVVLLNADLSALEQLDPSGVTIFWGANLGTAGQVLAAGPLADVIPRIDALRETARRAQGWVLDLYLLRRRTPPPTR